MSNGTGRVGSNAMAIIPIAAKLEGWGSGKDQQAFAREAAVPNVGPRAPRPESRGGVAEMGWAADLRVFGEVIR